jgi:hypothetical protein
MKPLFFIGGAVKSGTTWIQILLDSHPQLACRGEGHLANTLLPMMRYVSEKHGKQVDRWNRVLFSETHGFPRLREEDTIQLVRTAARMLLDRYGGDPQIVAIGEKTPLNVLHFSTLAEMFPGARFIHMVRDGRDCTVSNWHQAMRTRPGWIEAEFGGEFSRYVDHFAPVWARHSSAGERYVRDHPETSRQLRYEELKAEPHRQVQALLEFLGVPADSVTVQHCLDSSSFERITGGRKSGEEDRSSFFRKGVAGEWRSVFDEESLSRFLLHAEPELELFGYG